MPAAKKRRIANDDDERRSILLECGAEIVRHVYSFLSLKEALVLRQTCRRLNTGTDAYRYSQLFNIYLFPDRIPYPMGFTSGNETISVYWGQQNVVLSNLGHNDKLRAILLNTSLKGTHKRYLLDYVVEYSETDNGEAVSILLEEGEIHVTEYMLDIVLKRGFTAMAAALRQHDTIKAGIQMCSACSVNIGCYHCSNEEYDCPINASPNEDDDDDYLPKFCRSCALANDKVCVECENFLCPASCIDGHIYCNDCCI